MAENLANEPVSNEQTTETQENKPPQKKVMS